MPAGIPDAYAFLNESLSPEIAAQVAAAATADDDADLCALTEWCFRYVQAKEQNA